MRLHALTTLILTVVATLFTAGPSLAAENAPAARQPNVVLIVVDDMGWADLGCYGSKFHRTPQIDQLAKDGLRFTDAYAACPVCSPTRAAIMTGRWPARLNITDWLPGRGDLPAQKLARPQINHQLALDEVTIAEHLRKAGYRTASIGKWHLGGAGFGPEEQGFEVNIAGDQGGSPPGYFAPFGKAITGKKSGRALKGLEAAEPGSNLTDLLNDAAVNFIEKNKSEPFFLYLPHYAVHTPLQAKDEDIQKYPAEAKFSGKQNSSVYAAMIEKLDNGIGRILKKLEDLKLAENTLVIFTSDNGGLATIEGTHTPATSNSPLREGKGYLYEGGIRVPLIVRWPRGIQPRNETAMVSSVDLLPTILEACNLPAPANVDGHSIVPVWKSPSTPRDHDLFWHYPHYSNQGGKPGAAIRSGRWKLIEFYEDGHRELFDMTSDMREGLNLVSQNPVVVAELSKKLAEWRTSIGAKMMTPNPAYSPNAQAADGTVSLPAKWATVHGETLRFEPLPHKNTLGYWTNPKDWASWEFDLKEPGTFDVELTVGCGNGSGGSEVDVLVGDQKLSFVVEQTGGFQNFAPRKIGQIKLTKPGRYSLEIRPQKKPGAAVMDVPLVKLLPVK
ncbi:sulfatase-like hydrolase/transferase [Anatilimnocola sp. NA78]|uniref:sulfatase-like hydrolase/transferase n=1 Tax=Anatilimnocola sp. NA78 TaxID=3415683 RepID=UPI003CE459D7